MARLKTVFRDVGRIPSRVRKSTTESVRIKGRALQSIRFDRWRSDPHCETCGRITAYPYGFEIDHIVPLYQGGADSDSNRQLLCVDGPDYEGCHTAKTREDMGGGVLKS